MTKLDSLIKQLRRVRSAMDVLIVAYEGAQTYPETVLGWQVDPARLRYYRELHGQSVRELARLLGRATGPIYHWELGHSIPNATDIVRMCVLWHLSDVRLLGTHPDLPPSPERSDENSLAE